MIFEHTWQLVLDGRKTQTRRIRTKNTGLICRASGSDLTILEAGRYAVGKTYAVQPGRNQKAVARIRITGIRLEDVRDISGQDAIAEGFRICPKYEFLQVWTSMHDAGAGDWIHTTAYDPVQPDHCPLFLWDRPVERYQAVVYEFEVVTP